MTDVRKLLQEALSLPVEARAALVGSLLDSLDTEADTDAESTWDAEIAKRLKELDTGLVRGVSWSVARKQILGE